MKNKKSLTGKFLTGKIKLEMNGNLHEGNGKFLTLIGATGNNLKNITVKFPLGKFISITGVSGSGKSTLINQTLYPILMQELYSSRLPALEYQSIHGVEDINKVIGIDELTKYLNKQIKLKQAEELIVIKTRQYAKRQTTWARSRMIEWTKIEPQQLSSTIKKINKSSLKLDQLI